MMDLTYETFDTFSEAEEWRERNKIKSDPLWSEAWFCWVVWYRE